MINNQIASTGRFIVKPSRLGWLGLDKGGVINDLVQPVTTIRHQRSNCTVDIIGNSYLTVFLHRHFNWLNEHRCQSFVHNLTLPSEMRIYVQSFIISKHSSLDLLPMCQQKCQQFKHNEYFYNLISFCSFLKQLCLEI